METSMEPELDTRGVVPIENPQKSSHGTPPEVLAESVQTRLSHSWKFPVCTAGAGMLASVLEQNDFEKPEIVAMWSVFMWEANVTTN